MVSGSPASAPSSRIAAALDALASSLGHAVVRSGESEYDAIRSIWNGMFDRHPAAVVRARTAADVALAQATLERVSLGGLGDRRVDTLSGGQQQRVAIARALVQRPALLLADEPMASLDPALAHTVLSLLQRISEEDGLTVVTSLHVLELARLYGRRVLGLRAGRLVYDGPPDGLTDTVAEQIFAGRAA